MRAVRLHDVGDIRFEDVTLAERPMPGTVRLRVAHAGICGSDIHNFRTGQWISRRPSTAGHEISGVVVATGAGVTAVAAGDRVVADSRHWCGTCPACTMGRRHLCATLGFVGEVIDGGFADFVDLPERLVVPLPRDLPLDVAALAEPLAVALHALARVAPGDAPLAIIGCGPIGALAAVAHRLRSAAEITLCDRDAGRRALVAELVGASGFDLEDLGALTGRAEAPLRHVIDTTGVPGVIGTVLRHLSGGTLGLIGIGEGQIAVDPVHLVEREITLAGCHAFSDELPQAVALLAAHPDRFAPLIRHRIPLEAVPEEYAAIARGAARGIKTLVDIAPETGGRA